MTSRRPMRATAGPNADRIYTAPVASGLIAGESLMGVFRILLPLLTGNLEGEPARPEP